MRQLGEQTAVGVDWCYNDTAASKFKFFQWDEESGLLHLQTNIAAVNLERQQRSITTETPGLHQLQCDLEVLNKARWLHLTRPQVLTRGTVTTTIDNAMYYCTILFVWTMTAGARCLFPHPLLWSMNKRFGMCSNSTVITTKWKSIWTVTWAFAPSSSPFDQICTNRSVGSEVKCGKIMRHDSCTASFRNTASREDRASPPFASLPHYQIPLPAISTVHFISTVITQQATGFIVRNTGGT